MNRRNFLKQLGVSLASLPLIGRMFHKCSASEISEPAKASYSGDVEIWTYPMSDSAAKEKMLKAAEERRKSIRCPRPIIVLPNRTTNQYTVERVQVSPMQQSFYDFKGI